MIALRYAQYNERAVGENHPTREDTVNRALKDLIENSGFSPGASDIAFLTAVDLAAINAALALEITNRIADVDAEEAARLAADALEVGIRAAADVTLQTNINTVAANLATEITNRAADVDAEEAARIAADALKQDKLARGTVAVTTASLAPLAEELGTIALGKTGLLFKCVVDVFCRVRLYSSSAARLADTARTIGTDPATAAGVLADLVFDVTSGVTLNLQPLIPYNNNDGPVTTTIYYAIQNRSAGASTVTATFTRMVLES